MTQFLGDGWAQWLMAVTGVVALAVSGWAVLLLKQTLKATLAAVSEAKRSNDLLAAAHAADSRPWITIEAAVTDGFTFDHEAGVVRMRFKVSLENRGRSIAKDIAVQWQCNVAARGQEPDLSVATRGRNTRYVLVPDGRIEHLHVPYSLPIDRFLAVASSDERKIVIPILVVRATYNSTLPDQKGETTIAFSVYRKNGSELPALTIEDVKVPSTKLFVANNGGIAN